MTRRILNAGLLVLATLGALALVAALFLALGAPENAGDPTDAPSGERPVPCAEDDRACNEWIDVQESDQ